LIRMPLIFHSYELLAAAILVAAMVRTALLLGIVAGYALHIALDMIRHQHEFRSPLFYLLLYRLRFGFRRDRLIKPEYL
jgi:xanthine/uracil permease